MAPGTGTFVVDELGVDEQGAWLSGPRGILFQRGDEPPVVEVDGFVMLVPLGPHAPVKDWVASWNLWDGAAVHVDVTNTPRCDDRSVSAIDLDLDVVARRDSTVEVVDVDEFDAHSVLWGYPKRCCRKGPFHRWLVAPRCRQQSPAL